MAQKVQVVLVDDIDGSPGDQTVTFSYAGVSYEIDLSDANADKFADALAPYLANARKVGGSRRGRRRGAAARTGGPSASDVREWARKEGLEVSERGRIPADVLERYEAAH